MRSLELTAAIEKWPYHTPLRITGHSRDLSEVLVVTLRKGGHVGMGEAAGVRYHNENAASMSASLEALRPQINSELTRERLQSLLPAGGLRNALDCALWDLDAKTSGRAVWEMAGLKTPVPLTTTFTCSAEPPQEMAKAARNYHLAKALKLKLTGEPIDAERVRAVREARPDAWIAVDANQGFSRPFLEKLMPTLLDTEVKLIEQPFPIDQDSLLDGFHSPIPIAADESVQSAADLTGLEKRFDMINIKLDKCGGLTEGLMMARCAQELGMRVMVGNMGGTGLAMAPAFLVGQFCAVVDLDGPAFLKEDRRPSVDYSNGEIHCPKELWGYPKSSGEGELRR